MLTPRERKRIEHKLNIATQIYKTSFSSDDKKQALIKIKQYSKQLGPDMKDREKLEKKRKTRTPVTFTPAELLECLNSGMTKKEIGKKFGVSQPTIYSMQQRFIKTIYELKEVEDRKLEK